MRGRDPEEVHRASTPLELLFDLCFVVAVSQAAAQLHHGLLEDHLSRSLIGYGSVFFAIWWAWVNFTWFASAYDTDDVPYRLLTLVQMSGVLILAAGVPAAFNNMDFATATVGYFVMRIALVAQWLRAAHADHDHREVCRRYAVGIAVLQLGWIGRLWLPDTAGTVAFLALVILEVVVPLWAERSGPMTTWHPEHISERYGLFTIIVLGESVLAATVAVQQAIQTQGVSAELLAISVGSLLLLFGIWWSYFDQSPEEFLRRDRSTAFPFGYAHLLVFAAVAALGAGIQVAAETAHRTGKLSPAAAAFAVAVPVVSYLVVAGVLFNWLDSSRRDWGAPAVKAALVLAVALAVGRSSLPAAVLLMGLVMAGGIAHHVWSAARRVSSWR